MHADNPMRAVGVFVVIVLAITVITGGFLALNNYDFRNRGGGHDARGEQPTEVAPPDAPKDPIGQ
jgi:hypothetical protein